MSEMNQEQPITHNDVFGTPPSLDQSQQNQPSNQTNQNQRQEPTQREIAQALAELDKMEKFKFQGREWTPKDLEQAILRQKDYTKKTQELSKMRESFEQERKFERNLQADIVAVLENPSLATEFLKLYPEKYHAELRDALNKNQQSQQQRQQQTQNQRPPVDVDKEMRLQKLEKFYETQEVAKYTTQINSQIDSLSKKYPDALPELALARIYEFTNANPEAEVTDKMWEETFKAVDAQMKNHMKAKYGDLVKKQTEANKKARDVDSGGGTPGRAPPKFKGFKEITENAINDLKGRN